MTKEERKVIEVILERIKVTETDCYNYLVPGFLAKKIQTYMSMREDISHCKKALNQLITFKSNTFVRRPLLEKALWTSIIITYGKCFTDATKASKSKLEIKDCFVEGDDELREIHNKIMDLRHNFIAHRGETENEQSVVFMKIPKDEKLENVTQYKVKSLRATSHSITNLKRYSNLFLRIQQVVEQKLNNQTQKAHNAMLENLTAEELNTLLIR